jgi:C4-type Zn-finger protein
MFMLNLKLLAVIHCSAFYLKSQRSKHTTYKFRCFYVSLKCDSCLRKEHEVSESDDKMPKRISLIQVTETRQTKITQSEAS